MVWVSKILDYNQCCATTVYGTMYGYTVRYGNTAYSRIYTVLDRIYGKLRYGIRFGPNFESLSQNFKIELCFSSANGKVSPHCFKGSKKDQKGP